jgi:hypothetical protein
MSYLQNTVLDMKERIMLIFYRLRGARTEKEAARETERLENLIEFFKNDIEAKTLWTDKD